MEFILNNLLKILILMIVIIISIAFRITARKYARLANNTYLRLYPDAAKIYLYIQTLPYETVGIHSVGRNNPEIFYEGNKTGFYLYPGTHNIKVSFVYLQRIKPYLPKSYSIDIFVEANTEYLLGYDKKKKSFTLEKKQ